MLSAMHCPACDTPAEELETTIDGRVFLCAEHGRFGIVGSALVSREGFENETAQVRAGAYKQALQRAQMRNEPFPIITTYDYY